MRPKVEGSVGSVGRSFRQEASSHIPERWRFLERGEDGLPIPRSGALLSSGLIAKNREVVRFPVRLVTCSFPIAVAMLLFLAACQPVQSWQLLYQEPN